MSPKQTIIAGNGAIGSNTHQIFIENFDHDNAIYYDAGDFDTLIKGLQNREFDIVIVPVKNTIIGGVKPALDALNTYAPDITSIKEYNLAIHHAVITGPSGALKNIQKVYSYIAALDQCKNAIEIRGWNMIEHPDTSGAAKDVISRDDPSEAALAPPQAAEIYGGKILLDDLSDKKDNMTTFQIFEHQDF